MHMDRAIFELNVSVEATSLYILICALLDQGESPSLGRARVNWSGSDEELLNAAEELVRRGVIQAGQALGDEELLRINPSNKWA